MILLRKRKQQNNYYCTSHNNNHAKSKWWRDQCYCCSWCVCSGLQASTYSSALQ
jgi:hypothetical protein